jgi:hypothetical protein
VAPLPFPPFEIDWDAIRSSVVSDELLLKEWVRRSGKDGWAASESRLEDSLAVLETKKNRCDGAPFDVVASVEATGQSRTHLTVDVAATYPKIRLDRAIVAGGAPLVVGTDVNIWGLNGEFASDGTLAVPEVAGNCNGTGVAAVDGGILAGSLAGSGAPVGVP